MATSHSPLFHFLQPSLTSHEDPAVPCPCPGLQGCDLSNIAHGIFCLHFSSPLSVHKFIGGSSVTNLPAWPTGPCVLAPDYLLQLVSDPTHLPHTKLQSYLNSSFPSPPQTSAHCSGLRLREWHHHLGSCPSQTLWSHPGSPSPSLCTSFSIS